MQVHNEYDCRNFLKILKLISSNFHINLVDKSFLKHMQSM